MDLQHYSVVSGEHYLTAVGSSSHSWILGCRCGLMASAASSSEAMRKLADSHKSQHLLGQHMNGYADRADGSR